VKSGRRRSAGWPGALLGLLLTSCGPAPVAVFTGLEIVVAEGDGQFGAVGQILGTPLRALVRVEVTQQPREDVSVLWDIEQGNATLLGPTTATTDSTGSIEIRVQLGGVPSEIVVRARVAQQPSASTRFTVYAVERPVLSGVTPGSAVGGGTVTLTGSNFSPVAAQNVVLFSGIRGRVVSATPTQLQVEVPACLPARSVGVRVQLGAVASDSVELVVTGGGAITSLAVGESLDVADDGGFACFALEGGVGLQYLTLVYSASTVGAATHPYELTALSSSSPLGSPSRRSARAAAADVSASTPDPQFSWDEHVRTLEGELLVQRRGGPASRPARSGAGTAAVPAVGEIRVFNVLRRDRTFEQVTAVAGYVGSAAAIFVDQAAPAGGFTASDLAAFASRFDDVIHPEVTGAFGATSDLDANGRVIILFTPAVNRLTPLGSSGFIGGYFFGNDLLPGTNNPNSNGGEIFFSLVPDSAGVHGPPRSKSDVLSVVPAVLAHEFQHMVHFNQRYLGLDGGEEALWLSEALAQMAEEIVARRYEALPDAASAELFRSGTRARARRYLRATDTVSLIVSTGQGSLEERGAGFLHALYLADQEGIGVLGRLTSTTLRGVANVEAEVGREWPALLADWWSAILLDGPGPETGPLVYQGFDLRSFLGGPFPLGFESIGPGSVKAPGILWSSASAYYIVSPDPAGSMTVRLGGEAGGTSSPQAALRMRIIRLS